MRMTRGVTGAKFRVRESVKASTNNIKSPHSTHPINQCCGSGMIYSGSGSSSEFSEFRIRIHADPDQDLTLVI